MISIEKNKKKLDLIFRSTPVSNLIKHKSKESQNLIMDLVGWTSNYPEVNINSLQSKTRQFSKIMGSPALGVKVLGSESKKNHIWIINVESRTYIFYISLNGLAIETLSPNKSSRIIKDLKKIKDHFKIKSWKV